MVLVVISLNISALEMDAGIEKTKDAQRNPPWRALAVPLLRGSIVVQLRVVQLRFYSCARQRAQFGGDLLRAEGFNHIAHLDVGQIGEGHAALHAAANFTRIILEALQR